MDKAQDTADADPLAISSQKVTLNLNQTVLMVIDR